MWPLLFATVSLAVQWLLADKGSLSLNVHMYSTDLSGKNNMECLQMKQQTEEYCWCLFSCSKLAYFTGREWRGGKVKWKGRREWDMRASSPQIGENPIIQSKPSIF